MSAGLGQWGNLAVQGGALSLLSAVVAAIVRGWLVPGRTLDRLTVEWRERLAEAHTREEQWRQAYLTASSQAEALMVVARVTEQTMRALPTTGEVAP